jgi:hypothetical protein
MTAVIVGDNDQPFIVARFRKSLITGCVFAQTMEELHNSQRSGFVCGAPVKYPDDVIIGCSELTILR